MAANHEATGMIIKCILY